jgi:hypothetical protein
MKRTLFAAAALLLMASTANAASELRTLQTSGYWSTFYTKTSAGPPLCGMKTIFNDRNAHGSLMIKYIKGTKNLRVHVFKEGWRIPDEVEIPLYITFDNSERYKATGWGVATATMNYVEFLIAEDFTKSFLDLFAAASTMTLGFIEGSEAPWTSNMKGSTEAVTSFARCVVATIRRQAGPATIRQQAASTGGRDMKRTFLAAAILLTATTAQANVHCTVLTIRDLKQVSYTFTPYDEETFAETKVSREGNVLVHNRNAQPLWHYQRFAGIYSLAYAKDPRYRLAIKDDGEPFASVQIANVVLMRDAERIGIGACVFDRRSS